MGGDSGMLGRMMDGGLERTARAVWAKNGPDLRGLLSGRLSRSLGRSNGRGGRPTVPTLVFHSVDPDTLETQFRYLADSGYRTLDSEELADALEGKGIVGQGSPERAVALTFDDATGSFWAVAYPLLRKFGFKGILFVIPGVVPEGGAPNPNLEDVWAGRADMETVLRREATLPLCTWDELKEMHASGVVDIQSHSLNHVRVHVSSRLVDFLHPGFNPYFYGNVNIPAAVDDTAEPPARPLLLGRPVYASAARTSGRTRYLENPEVSAALVAEVARNGGEAFFSRPNWRRTLIGLHRELTGRGRGAYETPEAAEAAVRHEMAESKARLEARLPGKRVRCFCYPWFQGSALSDRIAAECGYRSVHYGLDFEAPRAGAVGRPLQVPRVSEHYVFCLPGRLRESVSTVWMRKALGFLRRRVRRSVPPAPDATAS